MLYKNRKFDIRHYMMLSRLHGRMRAYWYSEGYIRTSSEEFDIEELGNPMIHLTNDAIQKQGELYGRFEEGNKLSYAEFQRYLDAVFPDKKYSFI
jgi:tubulin polyglutamylase TTLL1/tubulin monoglycylase TTLL3/8